jgi:hypothetical protein
VLSQLRVENWLEDVILGIFQSRVKINPMFEVAGVTPTGLFIPRALLKKQYGLCILHSRLEPDCPLKAWALPSGGCLSGIHSVAAHY